MIWKKSCKKCGKKIEKNYAYCPYCGFNLGERQEREDYGLLGKNDDVDFLGGDIKMPFGFNTIFKKLVKEMDKQFREIDKQIGAERKMNKKKAFVKHGGISINISSGAGTPVIKIKSFGDIPEFRKFEEIKKEKARKEISQKREISEEKARELAKLPRQEAESKVRRLSGKVIYEIELPGVKRLDDVIINKLENSIEIKAFAKDKAFFKFLPIALPLLRYRLLKDKLILELGEK